MFLYHNVVFNSFPFHVLSQLFQEVLFTQLQFTLFEHIDTTSILIALPRARFIMRPQKVNFFLKTYQLSFLICFDIYLYYLAFYSSYFDATNVAIFRLSVLTHLFI